MRKRVPFFLLLILAGCHVASAPPPPPPTVVAYDLQWGNNGNPGVPVCSSSVTTGCLTTYTLTDIDSAPATVVSADINPMVASYNFSTTPGAHTYSLTVSGIDSLGNTDMSAPLVVDVTVPAS